LPSLPNSSKAWCACKAGAERSPLTDARFRSVPPPEWRSWIDTGRETERKNYFREADPKALRQSSCQHHTPGAGASADVQSRLRTKGAFVMPVIPTPPSRRAFVAIAAAASCAAVSSSPVQSQGANSSMEATIRTGESVITLVNVFTVDPAKLEKLVDVLKDGTETFFSKMPGFVSSSVLTARDGAKAVNYSQWKTAEDIAAFRKDARFAPYIRRLTALATAESIECEVVHVTRA
jgi:heme-degrading monooxygenase HmoA